MFALYHIKVLKGKKKQNKAWKSKLILVVVSLFD